MTRPSHMADSTSLIAAMNSAVRFRTAAVLSLVFATAVVNVIRLSTAGDQSVAEVPSGIPIIMGLLILYEVVTLVWLMRGRDHNRPLPAAWIYTNAVVEASAPTALAFSVGLSEGIMLQGAAMGPSGHLYGIFIVLSVLHVRMLVSLVAGLTSALGLAAVVIASLMTEGEGASEILGIPRSLEVFSAIILLVMGAAAALVALRMRRYLETATSEAEKRIRAERDLQAAALIQQSLMPSEPPIIPGFEIVGWNRPADETGGDYFDWVALDDGKFAVCIADVTGHGLGPAMITCFCRAYARTALRFEKKIAAAMSRLNSELVQDLGDGRFVTFAAVIITPNDSAVLSTSAGHGPLLVFRHADGEVASFGADALPLGVFDSGDEAKAITHNLDSGDVFLLVTDGFFEWANPSGEQYGMNRLTESLRVHGRKSGEALICGLLDDLETFIQRTPQPDDLTAVVIRRTPAEDVGDTR
ncbi:MAG: PP2C family protein-serine/threonine phosphatase [Planctomycetota bacterium]